MFGYLTDSPPPHPGVNARGSSQEDFEERRGVRSGVEDAVVPLGSGTSRRDTVRVTTYAQDGTFENAVSVEVRSPVRAVSNAVPFSVTCVTETPTGGASASGTASASP